MVLRMVCQAKEKEDTSYRNLTTQTINSSPLLIPTFEVPVLD